jgi:hypothetical protein
VVVLVIADCQLALLYLSRADAELELAEILGDEPGWRGSLTIESVAQSVDELLAEPNPN